MSLALLFTEDFDAPPRPPAPPPEPPPLGLTQSDIDRAVAQALDRAQADWAEQARAGQAQAVQALATELATARQEAAARAEAAALALARAALGMLAGALPHVCRLHGDAEVRGLLAHILPRLGPVQPVVRAHAGLIEALRQDSADGGLAWLEGVDLRAANLPPGDVRLAWQDGGLVRDTQAVCAGIRAGLAELGLLPAANEPATNEPDTMEGVRHDAD